MKNFLLKLWNDEDGAEMVEWVIVVAAIAAVGAGAWVVLGNALTNAMTNITGQMPS